MKNLTRLLLLLACASLCACQPAPSPTPDLVATQMAVSVDLLTTRIVATAQAAIPSATPTSQPSPTNTPTQPPTSSPSPFPSATPKQYSCNEAVFVSENLPDGSLIAPGESFTKNWTLRNTGTCTWDEHYTIVFIGGEAMNAPASQPFPAGTVAPGESLQLSMDFTAPLEKGHYRARFKLRNPEGLIFSFRDPQQSFWADIEVPGERANLATLFCTAEWTSSAGTLPCPGRSNELNGYIALDLQPLLENGTRDNEATLLMAVPESPNAFLEGTYPTMEIPENAKFSAILSCAPGQKDCHVRLSLSYRDARGLHDIASWEKSYDTNPQSLSADLSALAGQRVHLVLRLQALSAPQNAEVRLLMPVISP